jgi:hypothetical protein
MKRLSLLMSLGVVMALLALSFNVAVLAKAEPTKEKSTDSFDFQYFNECTGEWVSFHAVLKTFIFNSTDGHGNYHGHFLQQWHCTGVGETSGIVYVGPQTDHGSNYISSDGTFIGTYTENWAVNSRGGADNILGGALIHITINANGEVTTEIDEVKFECRG